jgi:hypothetical protein
MHHFSYKFNKKNHNVVASNPQFYRLAEKAGELEIKSVSNKNSKVRVFKRPPAESSH